jgi:hypothetical protein
MRLDAGSPPPTTAEFAKMGSILQDLEYIWARNTYRGGGGGAPAVHVLKTSAFSVLDIVEALVRWPRLHAHRW